MQAALSSAKALAVIAITRLPASCVSARMRRVASSPSMSGICRSINTASKGGSASSVTRDYLLEADKTGGAPLLNVWGGKLTTYREMAADTVDEIALHREEARRAQVARLVRGPDGQRRDGLAETVAWYKNNEAWWRPLKAKAAL